MGPIANAFLASYNPLDVAKKLANVTAPQKLSGPTQKTPSRTDATVLGALDPVETLAAVGIGALVAVVVARGVMGYYVGHKFNRGVSGALVGSIFGAPGMGVVALFGKGS